MFPTPSFIHAPLIGFMFQIFSQYSRMERSDLRERSSRRQPLRGSPSFRIIRPSNQPIGFELPGCAREEDLEDCDHRYREQYPGEIEQDAAANDPDYHRERM